MRRLAMALLGMTLMLAPTLGTAERAVAAEGLTFEAHSTYTVDPTAGVIRVSVDLVATNTKAPTVSGNIRTTYFFDRLPIPVLATATNFAATREGNSQSVTIEQDDGDRFKVAFIDMSPNVNYRDVARVRLSYDIPSEAPRTNATTRVNNAYATFWSFPIGDPSLTSVRILIPDDYEVELLGDDLDRSESGGMVLYESGAISNPDEWFVIVSARNDKALARTRTELLDHIIEIKAWPDDRRWARFVRTQLNEGLPELESLIDLPWSNPAKLQIIETVSPYLYGYAGWYSSSDNTIEIGDELEAEVILHEIAHIWFNDDLFAERWVNEGYAQTYSNLALEQIGGRDRAPKKIKPNGKGAQALNLWDNPSFRDEEEAEAQEAFGYNASWFVIDAITDEIGPDKMREVLAAAHDGQITYLGDPAPEHTTETLTWRQLLDLYQEIGGSEDAPDLFRTHVVSARQRSDLRDRDRARAAYAKLVDAGNGWSAPLEVREQMGRWRFGRATEAMQTAKRILAVRDEIETTLDGTGVELPESFERNYEGKVEDLDALLGSARGYLASAKLIAAADEAAQAGKGVFGSIGLWGNDYEELLDTAGTRFEDGDIAGAARAATQVSRVLDDADSVGQGRALKAGGTVVGVGMLGWSFRRVRRRRRTRRAEREAEARAHADAAASIAAAEQASAASVPAWAWWYGTTEPTTETDEGDDAPRALDTAETSEAPEAGSDATSAADQSGPPAPEATTAPLSLAGTDGDTAGGDSAGSEADGP